MEFVIVAVEALVQQIPPPRFIAVFPLRVLFKMNRADSKQQIPPLGDEAVTPPRDLGAIVLDQPPSSATAVRAHRRRVVRVRGHAGSIRERRADSGELAAADHNWRGGEGETVRG